MLWFYILIFIISWALLYFCGGWLVGGLMRIARYLGWKEFVVSFIIMAFAASLPNLFVGISSALRKIPQLSLGDIVGGNLVDLTLAVALAALVAGAGISAESRTVQTTSSFTIASAILYLILTYDREISRSDGIILISFFFVYIFWLFSKKERFTKIYGGHQILLIKGFKFFLKDLGKVISGIIILLFAAEGIVRSSKFFAEILHFPIALIGLLIVGIGNALPDTYFAVASAKKGETWMILGDLMGSVVITTTLVLGIVALICPIKIENVNILPFFIARIFLIISAIFFFFFVKTGRKITKKEGLFLLLIYILFFLITILFK